jgi:hypothetical protein
MVDSAGGTMRPTFYVAFHHSDIRTANRFCDVLAGAFGTTKRQLIDEATVRPDRARDEVIASAIAFTDKVVALVSRNWNWDGGPMWPDAAEPQLRTELETALELGKEIVPVFVEHVAAIGSVRVPPSLVPIVHQRAFRLSTDSPLSAVDPLFDALRTDAEKRRTPVPNSARATGRSER